MPEAFVLFGIPLILLSALVTASHALSAFHRGQWRLSLPGLLYQLELRSCCTVPDVHLRRQSPDHPARCRPWSIGHLPLSWPSCGREFDDCRLERYGMM